MTTPVLQEKAPVQDTWKVRFMMPAKMIGGVTYRPNNSKVQIINLPPSHMAVIRFSGLAGENSLKQNKKKLDSWLEKNHIIPIGNPVYAFYDSPWTLPFFRRNEVMKEVVL